jgi:hypothetical protein
MGGELVFLASVKQLLGPHHYESINSNKSDC